MHSYLKIIFKLMMILLLGVGDIYLGYKTFVKFSINKIEVEATDNDWKEEMLLLVNAEHPLMDNYYFEKYELRNGQLIDKRIYPYLKQMFDEMKELGLRAFVRSGYRDYNQQEELFKERYLNYLSNGLNEDEALVLTQKEVALPKTSEHETGLAVDINSDMNYTSNQEVYEWLAENAHRYGFILRYPLDKQEITGVQFEPWHYRFVGIENAKEIYEEGYCLEEYIQVIEANYSYFN